MDRQRFATQTLVAVLFFNAALMAVTYGLAGQALQDDLALFIAAGAVLSLILWFVIYQIGKPREAPAAERAETREREETRREEAPAAPEMPAQPSPVPAIQMLSLLQRKGRLIDFLQEDLQRYDDAQIGAAVRNVHAGCKEALDEYVELEAIFDEPEGSEVTIEPDFDAHEIRLTGAVTGDPPFRGAVQHRGWRVKNLNLPALMKTDSHERVLSAAEVEVNTSSPAA